MLNMCSRTSLGHRVEVLSEMSRLFLQPLQTYSATSDLLIKLTILLMHGKSVTFASERHLQSCIYSSIQNKPTTYKVTAQAFDPIQLLPFPL